MESTIEIGLKSHICKYYVGRGSGYSLYSRIKISNKLWFNSIFLKSKSNLTFHSDSYNEAGFCKKKAKPDLMFLS